MKHLLKLEGMPKEDMLNILSSVKDIKKGRGANEPKPLNLSLIHI